MKYSNEYREMCIEMYYEGKYPETPDGITTSNFHHQIREWVRKNEKAGIETVMHKEQNRRWTPEERLNLVEQVVAGRGCKTVAEENGVNKSVLSGWVRKYRMEGYEGLVNMKKGRPPKEPEQMPKKNEQPRELTESEREELLRLRAENEYLKAETAALKKSMALRREREAERLKAKKHRRFGNSGKKDTD